MALIHGKAGLLAKALGLDASKVAQVQVIESVESATRVIVHMYATFDEMEAAAELLARGGFKVDLHQMRREDPDA